MVIAAMPPPTPEPREEPSTPKEETEVDELAELAMILREEQVEARVVHYKEELETNAELDAITAQVVAQLRELQAKVAADRSPESRAAAELEQVRSLSALLSRLFRQNEISVLVEQVLKGISRRVTKLFFDSELSERAAESAAKVRQIDHSEQALFYVLRRYQNRLRAELEGFEYVDADTREDTMALLEKTTSDLRVAFLARRSPELKRVLAVTNSALLEFFQRTFPPTIEDFSREVLTEAKTGRAPNALGYKILHEQFSDFRKAFERRLLGVLVADVVPRVTSELARGSDEFRGETVAFVSRPQLYSELVSVASSAIYDFLCNEGFLDLPIDWRRDAEARALEQG